MTLYQAMVLLIDMAKSNNEGIKFVGEFPILDNIAGDCLRSFNVQGGYEAVLNYWLGWQGLTAIRIQLVWKMAGVPLKNCTVEMD